MFSEEEIKQRVGELAGIIARDYKDRELVLVGLLHGGTALLTDLARELWHRGLTTNVYKDYLGLSSYGADIKSSGSVVVSKKLKNDLSNKHVLIVEDIVDTGHTIAKAIEILRTERPASLKTLSLLSKPSRREVEVEIDYLGFEIENVFVVGYDLDYDEKYRTMPYIGKVIFD